MVPHVGHSFLRGSSHVSLRTMTYEKSGFLYLKDGWVGRVGREGRFVTAAHLRVFVGGAAAAFFGAAAAAVAKHRTVGRVVFIWNIL